MQGKLKFDSVFIENMIDQYFQNIKLSSTTQYYRINDFPSNIYGEYYRVLLESFKDLTLVYQVKLKSSIASDPFLTSRLLMRGFELELDINYIYSLADAIKTSSLIEAMRLQYICNYFLKRGNQSFVFLNFFNQSSLFINTLISISNDPHIKKEKSILNYNYGFEIG
ncbi:hypothetical protein HDF18_13075 [Mucilaginibacter sp. X5P1]|uniref:hypothetical protein n=1 Tax=Mucilaginibacter sp. X5P1 TaxID=2723088 RepID=UPI001621CE2C|nr:hypothetical protein [Mucilaginibacter sp. X5P1]MBB6141729.1 hypothetical protein [Mucilaginibacter sp. X5P1]